MTNLMRAIRKLTVESTTAALVSLAVPDPGPQQVRLAVLAAGVCGTDVHILDGEYASEPPVTLGHEVVGRVDAVGTGIDPTLIGRRFAVETYFTTCGECKPCRDARPNLCMRRRSIGSFEDGGFAEYIIMPAANLHEVPDGVADHAAALLEPLACVCHCLRDPDLVRRGDRVLVIGPGAMGLLAAQVARASGGEVTLAGLPADKPRLAIARAWGVRTSTVPTEAESFDVVVECSGSAGGVAAGLHAVSRGGRYVVVGIVGRPIEVDLDVVLYKELTVTSGFASTRASWRMAVALVDSGEVDLEPVIGTVAGLDDWDDVIAGFRSGAGSKTVLDPRLRPGP